MSTIWRALEAACVLAGAYMAHEGHDPTVAYVLAILCHLHVMSSRDA